MKRSRAIFNLITARAMAFVAADVRRLTLIWPAEVRACLCRLLQPKLAWAFSILGLMLFTGCESEGGGSASVSGGVYYGVGVYDPWYYGGDCDDPDIIVTPPDRPDAGGPRPEHPIAKPPASTPRPTPMPSIPSTPRASFRR